MYLNMFRILFNGAIELIESLLEKTNVRSNVTNGCLVIQPVSKIVCERYRLILSQSFHKWRNMLKFCYVFIFVIIKCINMWISTFCEFDDQKREYDVIFMDSSRLHVIVFCAFTNLKSTSCKMHHPHIVTQNNIIFSFLIIKVTKCWNSHVDRLNNNKYKYLTKLQHVSSLMEKLRQN